ncbi:MBL fold metallo-hydrolase [Actinomadura opuntiae]|uniref:MBL fold metallo-hydrolase n=1 Tax=Actinomadura sp. OS1-43 TaxID=604315 RepID=UPI00255ACC56|nr:MBL fold metallo-hydrolase [Actinomadura sp. OS1-43]MDL4812673.1 MBL fold metallo-hydrolase [Actinomadura sp. OS1-43]
MSERPRVGSPVLAEVAPGVHAYVQPDGGWMLNNTGVVTGSGGEQMLVDTTSTEARNRAMLDAVAALADRPPKALVNTHHHGDHVSGNWLMPPGTPIFGHSDCRAEVLRASRAGTSGIPGPDYGRTEVRPPDVTFSAITTLYVGDRPIELIPVGPAHTRGDVLVWLPEDKVLFSGDIVFNGGQPFLVEGSLPGYRRALSLVRRLLPDVLVPGHGPVCRGEEIATILDELNAYTEFVEALAREGLDSGRSPLEMAESAAGSRFSGWQEAERLAGNLHRAYSEFGGDPYGARMDARRMWSDMARIHGGPIRSRA